jgi:hypothetical protein
MLRWLLIALLATVGVTALLIAVLRRLNPPPQAGEKPENPG